MNEKVATLFEYVPYLYEPDTSNSFSAEERILCLTEETLQEFEQLNKAKCFLEMGRRTLRPLNYIGVVKVGDLTVQILPKLFKGEDYTRYKRVIAGNVLKMLSYAESLPITEIDIADLDTEEFEFFEVFVWLFAKNLAELIKSHLSREYVTRREALPYVRERIDIRRYANPARLHIVPCIYHEFSVDNPLNRTLKYTCHLMFRMVRSTKNYRLLKFITNVLDPVTLIPVGIDEIDRISFNRLNQRFEPFIRICRIFLSHATLTLRASHEETFALLLPMEKLFEEFIVEVLREDPAYFFSRPVTILPQQQVGTLAESASGRGVFQLLPDIVIQDRGALAIIDTKYKRLNLNKTWFDVKQPDMYQMYAYVTKTHASGAMLLYPDTEEMEYGTFFFEYSDAEGSFNRVPLYIRSVRLSENLNTKEGWEAFRSALAKAVKGLVSPVEEECSSAQTATSAEIPTIPANGG